MATFSITFEGAEAINSVSSRREATFFGKLAFRLDGRPAFGAEAKNSVSSRRETTFCGKLLIRRDGSLLSGNLSSKNNVSSRWEATFSGKVANRLDGSLLSEKDMKAFLENNQMNNKIWIQPKFFDLLTYDCLPKKEALL